MVSGLGGGIIRDILLGAVPSATFSDWRYLAVAAAGGLAAFALSSQLARLATLITVLDAAGLGLFAVTGTSKALDLGLEAPRPSSSAPSPASAGERCEMSSSGKSRRCYGAGCTPSRPCPPQYSQSRPSAQGATGCPPRSAPCSRASSSGSSASATT
jgi:hypothetical protein